MHVARTSASFADAVEHGKGQLLVRHKRHANYGALVCYYSVILGKYLLHLE